MASHHTPVWAAWGHDEIIHEISIPTDQCTGSNTLLQIPILDLCPAFINNFWCPAPLDFCLPLQSPVTTNPATCCACPESDTKPPYPYLPSPLPSHPSPRPFQPIQPIQPFPPLEILPYPSVPQGLKPAFERYDTRLSSHPQRGHHSIHNPIGPRTRPITERRVPIIPILPTRTQQGNGSAPRSLSSRKHLH